MPTPRDSTIPKPTSEDEFETIVLALYRRIWGDPGARRNGKRGQAQDGVDIYGRPGQGDRWTGVQARLKTKADARVTRVELRAEVEKAKAFKPPLADYIIATTADDDVVVLEEARIITSEHLALGLFTVTVDGWGELSRRLGEFPDVLATYYPDFGLTGQADRPMFEVSQRSMRRSPTGVTPEFKVTKCGGDGVPTIEWRWPGPGGPTSWEQLSGSDLPRMHFAREFDFGAPSVVDPLVGPDQIGLELRFPWRRRMERELHRWRVERAPTSDGSSLWSLAAEILPALHPDDTD